MNWKRRMKQNARDDALDGREEIKVGWKDQLAMYLSGIAVIAIPCLLALAALVLPTMWLFGAL